MNSMTNDPSTPRTAMPVEDRGDELVVRRPDWMTDQQWAQVRAGLEAAGWEAGAGADSDRG